MSVYGNIHRMFITVFIISFICGIAFTSLTSLGFMFSLFLFFLGFVLLLTYPVIKRSGKKSRLVVSLCILGVALGMIRFDIGEFSYVNSALIDDVGSEIEVLGWVSNEPESKESYLKFVVTIVQSDDSNHKYQDRILVSTPLYPKFEYGNLVKLKGIIKFPENFDSTESGKTFDYVSYLAKDKIGFVMFQPKVEVVGYGEGSKLKTFLFTLKNMFLKSVSQTLPEPHASLLGGLVVGAKESLGQKLLDDFRSVGLIHIVVLSGYNVTIVADALMRVVSFLPQMVRACIGGLGIIFFMLLTGAGATIVRASIMALIVVFSRVVGREFDVVRALLLVGFVMVLHNPYIVIYDPSFQLSFLAMLGLIYVSPIVETWFMWLPKRFGLRDIAGATIGTQIFVLPLLLYMMGEFSIVALPVNFLVLVFIPLTMLTGFLAGVLGLIGRTIALPFSLMAFILLYYELMIVGFFAKFSFATISVKQFPLWLMIVCYFVYCVVLYKIHKKRNQRENT